MPSGRWPRRPTADPVRSKSDSGSTGAEVGASNGADLQGEHRLTPLDSEAYLTGLSCI